MDQGVIPTGRPDLEQYMCGGWGETMDATEEIQDICNQVKGQVEKKANKKYVEYKAVKYRKQTVRGYKYRIKVHVGGADYIHVGVFQPPEKELDIELLGMQEDRTEEDAV